MNIDTSKDAQVVISYEEYDMLLKKADAIDGKASIKIDYAWKTSIYVINDESEVITDLIAEIKELCSEVERLKKKEKKV